MSKSDSDSKLDSRTAEANQKKKAETFGLGLPLVKYLVDQRQLSPYLDQPADNIILHFLRDMSRKREYVRLILSRFPKSVRMRLCEEPQISAAGNYVFELYMNAAGKSILVKEVLLDLNCKFDLPPTKQTIKMVKKMRKKAHNRIYYERKLIEKYFPANDLSDEELGAF